MTNATNSHLISILQNIKVGIIKLNEDFNLGFDYLQRKKLFILIIDMFTDMWTHDEICERLEELYKTDKQTIKKYLFNETPNK